jgi:hypothetical protein
MYSNAFPIKAVFFTKNRLIGEQLFQNNISFGQIKDFYKENLSDGTTAMFNSYFLNSIKLNDSDMISQFIQIEPNSQPLEISILIELRELNELKRRLSLIKFDDERDQVYSQIIQPKLDPFGFIVYLTESNTIQIEQYPNEITVKYGLNNLSNNFAYCNSQNALFISGGEYLNSSLDDFWIINKKNYSIKRIKMPVGKQKHSMIYIPSWGVERMNLGSVFFVGGEDKQTFFYDLKRGQFYKWGDTSNIHDQPALFLYGNYLYCFNLLNNKVTFFEKTYLGKNTKRVWEKVFPRFKGVNTSEFYNNNFVASKSIEGNILLIGGNDTNKGSLTFIFNPLNNTIIDIEGENENINLVDKNLYKLNKVLNIAIPSDFWQNKELAIINKYNYSLYKKRYKAGQKDPNSNFDMSLENNPELYNDNQIGNITLKSIFSFQNQRNQNYVKSRIVGNPMFFQSNQQHIQHNLSVPQIYNRNYQQNRIYNRNAYNQNINYSRNIMQNKQEYEQKYYSYSQRYMHPKENLCKECSQGSLMNKNNDKINIPQNIKYAFNNENRRYNIQEQENHNIINEQDNNQNENNIINDKRVFQQVDTYEYSIKPTPIENKYVIQNNINQVEFNKSNNQNYRNINNIDNKYVIQNNVNQGIYSQNINQENDRINIQESQDREDENTNKDRPLDEMEEQNQINEQNDKKEEIINTGNEVQFEEDEKKGDDENMVNENEEVKEEENNLDNNNDMENNINNENGNDTNKREVKQVGEENQQFENKVEDNNNNVEQKKKRKIKWIILKKINLLRIKMKKMKIHLIILKHLNQ